MHKLLLVGIVLVMEVCPAFARDVQVRGYTRKDGTYVQPHTRSQANDRKDDNYGKTGSRGTSSYGTNSGDTRSRDSDGDGILNQYDHDDDNDGIPDERER